MSAHAIPLLAFVQDMERCAAAPFRRQHTGRLLDLAYDMREAALAGDARAIAHCVRATRLERLWALEAWAWARSKRHPRIWLWITTQLCALKARELEQEAKSC